MEKLNRMAIFAIVVNEGSLAGAARRLGMSPSAVSQHLRALEQSVGVPLLHRSTRKLALSEAGAAFFPGCKAMLDQAQEAEKQLAEMRDTLTGELRISSTPGIGGQPLCSAMSPMLQQHPGLKLRILATDNVLDMIEHRIDIALRFSRQLSDANIIAHPLAEWPMVVCAAPGYLSRYGVPETATALISHRWVHGHRSHQHVTLHHPREGSIVLRMAEGQIVSDSMHVIRAFTVAGMGVSLQPLHEVQEELSSGQLMLLLPEWRADPLKLTALTLERVLPEKSRQALRALREYFSHNHQLKLVDSPRADFN
ncbi:LysR substrate-binding domain-containing protein [Erwinia tasmaniensis]|uniref:Transcriptional regulator, LysR n=1 Tax=Erwinia tasmaniensis (strain DSM 17950 / CFBP 7177 / CIP 109463 / NCPPB 4357 / Et1/99) TaxID=465817 RepID=B2VEP3_ERWT9|nr:LysR substrate-binding domain-containing protein [Erwinia tasmaniensis]CAO96843.1 Putative transcriptional regulator, LysR [Erwinia tasmaniensis Et1/99]